MQEVGEVCKRSQICQLFVVLEGLGENKARERVRSHQKVNQVYMCGREGEGLS